LELERSLVPLGCLIKTYRIIIESGVTEQRFNLDDISFLEGVLKKGNQTSTAKEF
jgi:hypothetical protein